MKQRTHNLFALLMVLVMAISAVVPAFAAGAEPFAYEGEEVNFINADGEGFGMFAPQEGTTAVIKGDDVVIHYVPKNTTIYGFLHWGAITEELTKDLTFNADGTFDITLPKANCGTAVPVAPIKTDERGGGTTSTQYYLAIPAEDKLEDATPVASFPYDGEALDFIKADGSGFGMFTPQEGTTAVIKGDDVVIHYVPKNTTIYGFLHWGAITDELTKDLTFNADGTFDITLPKTNCGTAIPVAPIKIKDGGTTKDQYYLAIPAEDKLGGETPVDPDPTPVDPDPTPAEDRTELTVVNNAGMFKAYSAYVAQKDGNTILVVALNGKTYQHLYKGTYVEAVANGDKRENWISYALDENEKYAFVLPLAEGETVIPVVSISSTYLDKFEKGENPLERAFFPRQFVLDLSAKTLTVGDYDGTVTVTVKSKSDAIRVADKASMRVVGGPNSNNFNLIPVLQMLDDTYDQVTYPTVVDGKLTTATAALSADKTFTINLLNAPKLEAFRDKEPITVQLRVKATGKTVAAKMTIDLLSGAITLEGGSVEKTPSVTSPNTNAPETAPWASLLFVLSAGAAVVFLRKSRQA